MANIHRIIDGLKFLNVENSDILEKGDANYRVYYIKKADGGKREIAEPSTGLCAMQKAVLPYIKSKKMSGAVSAYESGCSTKINASKHQKANHILHLDIEKFFPSINKEIFKKTYGYIKGFLPFTKKGMPDRDFDLLWSIVSYKGGLPIGAITSPFIANRVMLSADKKLSKLKGVDCYTRYADDLIFSAKKPISKSFISEVEQILKEEGFIANHQKTYFMSTRKEVTGIKITDKHKLSVGTSYKKDLKQGIYNYLVKGKGKENVLRGKFEYLKHVEPHYADIIKNKYQPLDKVGFFGK